MNSNFQSKGKKRQVGWFPASYVKLMESGGSEKAHAAPSGRAESLDNAPKFRALFAYAGQHEDELSFQVGLRLNLPSS